MSQRLSFLEDVGLDYLTLDRSAATLSGGEGQRIRLATQIGSKLSGILYVLDEPSIGLHQRDNARLLRCESCKGDGLVKIEMHFLPDVYVTCDVCNGRQFNKETLEIKFKGKNIAQILDMTVNQALEFFDNISSIRHTLSTLVETGLGYIKLGQAATTLSGGEAQRIKIARELSKKSTGKTIYILDEPTTGLHTDDIKRYWLCCTDLWTQETQW